MTIHITGTIFTSEGLQGITAKIHRETKVLPLGPKSGIEVGDDYWGMWWQKRKKMSM